LGDGSRFPGCQGYTIGIHTSEKKDRRTRINPGLLGDWRRIPPSQPAPRPSPSVTVTLSGLIDRARSSNPDRSGGADRRKRSDARTRETHTRAGRIGCVIELRYFRGDDIAHSHRRVGCCTVAVFLRSDLVHPLRQAKSSTFKNRHFGNPAPLRPEAQRARLGMAAQKRCAEIRLRAERKLGQ